MSPWFIPHTVNYPIQVSPILPQSMPTLIVLKVQYFPDAVLILHSCWCNVYHILSLPSKGDEEGKERSLSHVPLLHSAQLHQHLQQW